MNFNAWRFIILAIAGTLLVGGGLYLKFGELGIRLPVARSAAVKNDSRKATKGKGAGPGAFNSAAPHSQGTTYPNGRPTVFGLTGPVHLDEIPEGRFRNELTRLAPAARLLALEKLGKLQVPLNDVASLSVDQQGGLFYQCRPPRLPPRPAVVLSEVTGVLAGSSSSSNESVAEAPVPIATPPAKHSRPGSTKIIYLDFNGHTITGTVWNEQQGNVGEADYRPAVASYVAKPFDMDGDPTSFSDTEQTVIARTWERVSEDFKGFDVDVTTEEPVSFTKNTGRILITDNVDANAVKMPSSTAGGVAYLDVFGANNYVSRFSPALVFANQNYNNPGYMAESASHEIGHNLSLSHDGTASGDEYYDGHGSGETSWSTIMGTSFYHNVTQWSKGEYFNSNNTEDDLAMIAGHLGYVTDDHTDNNATATPLTVNGLAVSGLGIISKTGDADRFSFASGPGSVSFTASPFRSANYTYGGNLDVALELYDSGGSLVVGANVDGTTTSTLNLNVSGGTYYLRVLGAAAGAPLNNPPTGYTNYASLGQYTIAGTIVSTTPVAPAFSAQPSNQTVTAGQPAQLVVAVGAYPAATYQWQRSAAGGSGWSNVSDVGIYSGATTVRMNISAATLAMNGDQFRCVATNTVSSTTSSPATLTVNPVIAPGISGLPASVTVNYGDSLSLIPTITGTQPITYQWKKGGVNIGGAITSAFNKSYVTTADGGLYALTATNAAGAVTSSTVNVTVNAAVAPGIISQPVSLSVVVGSAASFSVSASGSNPLSFQWYLNGQAISGANASALLISAAQLINAGTYTVVVTGPGGAKSSNPATLAVRPLAGVVAAFASSNASQPGSLFIKGDGSLWAMGGNSYGQLGDGSGLMRTVPIQVSTNVISAAFGALHSLVIKSDRTLWAAGLNNEGQLGVGTTYNQVGLVYVASNVVAVSAGGAHSLFIKSDGTLWGMGANASGQLGDGTATGRLSPVQIATDVVAAMAGQEHSLFITSDGTLWGMGVNGWSQTGTGPTGPRYYPIKVAAGVDVAAASLAHSLFVKSDRTLWGLGANYRGQLGDGTSETRFNPIQIAAGVATAALGENHSLFVKSDGNLWGTGENNYGQLGDGTVTGRFNPVQISTGVSSVAGGSVYSMYCKTDGTLMGMGRNFSGQLGTGIYYTYLTPTRITGGSLFIPDVPTGIEATDGTVNGGVRLTWNPTIGATRYEVWRSVTNNAASAVLIASNVSSALAYDLAVVAGVKYYYWIKSVNPAGASALSSSDSGFSRIKSADFNQDGQSDILWQNVGSGDHGIWIMNGTVPAAWINLPAIALDWRIVGTGDFNGDGQTDILWENVGSGDRGMWIMSGTVPAAWINLPSIALNWRIVGTGDFNSDGMTDILWENVGSGDRGMWIMNGTIPVAWINLPSIALNWLIAGTGDFNGDGMTDILWENVGSGDRGMWIMNATVPVAWINLPSIALNWRIAGTGDFNADGQTDILWENVGSGDRGMWIMNSTVPSAWINLPSLALDWRIAQ